MRRTGERGQMTQGSNQSQQLFYWRPTMAKGQCLDREPMDMEQECQGAPKFGRYRLHMYIKHLSHSM